MKTLTVKTKTGRIIIEMGDDDCPIQALKEHGIINKPYKIKK